MFTPTQSEDFYIGDKRHILFHEIENKTIGNIRIRKFIHMQFVLLSKICVDTKLYYKIIKQQPLTKHDKLIILLQDREMIFYLNHYYKRIE